MLTTLNAMFLGIVEGITEFLPISSTGHLVLASDLLRISQTNFVKSFEIAIQLGAILSVVVLYWQKVIVNWEIWKRIIVAFVPTAILGAIFYKIIKGLLLGNNTVIVYSLLIGGILIILFEWFYQEKENSIKEIEKIPLAKAAWLGVFQSVAMIPGVSRSAATILGGMALGVNRKAIVEFSFLLAAPTMLAATGLDLLKSGGNFSANQFKMLFVGFVVSFIVAILAIKFLLRFIKNHSFISFGIYRIILALVFITLILK
jgi:undecaprenyl-diphosphatase